MIKINIRSSSRFPVERLQIRLKVREVLARFKLKEAVVGVYFVGDRKMRRLNKEYRKIDQTTDVLSFSLNEETPDGNFYLGEIVVSYPKARRQANEHNLTVDQEINKLVEHGALHLMGINHK